MSEKKLKEKLQQEKRRQKNSVMNKKQGIINNMHIFAEDSKDFSMIFNHIEENDLNPDKKVFREADKKTTGTGKMEEETNGTRSIYILCS